MSKEKYFAQPSSTGNASHFAQVPSAEIERSKFDRSHGYKSCFNAGGLYPIFVDEVLPGDTYHMNATSFARLATPLKSFMDNMYLDTHFFFVPYRIVWDNFQKFMGERVQPSDDPSIYTVPQTTINISEFNNLGAVGEPKLWNYFGIPYMYDGATPRPISVSALPFRAYMLIYNEWYRDQNLIPTQPISLGDGPDLEWDDQLVMSRGKRHDYFTSALPWPQKGDPVYIPLGTAAPVVGIDQVINFRSISESVGTNHALQLSNTGGANVLGYVGTQINPAENARWGTSTALLADLTEATAVSINDLRTAFQIQRLLERDARGGTRYIELILSHFGVRSDDGRLQRPEFLGGGTAMLNINPVAQTVQDVDTPQGNLAAVGTGVNKAGFTKSFTEHGVIIGIISARADLTYQQGLERFWSRQTRYDFYWPALSHLGEQAIKNKEIYISGTATDEEVFGYQERYAEYRYKPSRITAQFSSEVQTSLDIWHLSQDFAQTPGLNAFFISDFPPVKRVVAVPSEPDFLLDTWFSLQCERPMPVYSVPGLIDHF